MKSSFFALFLLAFLLTGVFASTAAATEASPEDWANWRGPDYNGTSPSAKPPVKWSEEENIRWKVPISGKGSSSPIIWGDKLFVLTAVPVETEEAETESDEGEAAEPEAPQPREESADRPRRGPGNFPGGPRGPGGRGPGGPRGRGGFGRGAAPTTPMDFTVVCLDKSTGEKIWSTVAIQAVPHESGHNTNTFASSSAVTNGEILVAFFGSRGIYCLSMDGKLLWKRDLGQQQTRNAFGEGSTPALYKNTIIIPWDHEGDSFVLALNATTGEDLWKVDRDEATSWATPVVTEHNGTAQVILNGSTRVRSYDVTSGKLIWECGGQATNPIATPIIYDGKAICMTGYRGYAVYAIDLNAKGDVTDNEDYIAWSRSDVGPYIASATLLNDRLYVTKSRDGVLYCLDASTGETIFGPERLPEASTLYSSLVAADGKVYVSDRDGTTVVLEDGPEFKVLAVNQLAEGIDASIALSGNQLFLRSEGHLYCIQQADGK
ncbi:outer membrane protein assembly factor BamB family protein [Bremerella sp. P1]|uniref:outer membrane protein assembly factor BamB family protein n=1 Tax=Bremerella sp. P1 TaxID=3026424 RepID=UPI002367D790|nr:PQQ-binding-like beta-propeller repeat protein [Bremerella sp. P1]WDI41861.1 PQQ-binding-like beta-propeller repeat protein [Bremerella sp. P1]